MKKLLLVALIGLFGLQAKAQFAFDLVYENDRNSCYLTDTIIVAKGYIKNTSGKNSTFNWSITKNGLPSAWVTTVTSGTVTNNASVTQGSIAINNNDSVVLNINVKPLHIIGMGKIIVDVSDQTDPFDIVESELTFYVMWEGITTPPTPTIQLYPNPVSSLLTITSITHKPATIQLFNALGQKQQTITYEGLNATVIDMSGLAPGIYYIRYVDENGQAVSKPVQKF
jgi:hypothetical protein